jgi:cyclophilin family peptidyl-prolyl cis-trans isomerase
MERRAPARPHRLKGALAARACLRYDPAVRPAVTRIGTARLLLVGLVGLVGPACSGRGKDRDAAATGPDGGSPPAASAARPADLASVLRAEDTRRAKDVGAELATSHAASSRRLAARAYARIADGPSREALLPMLADEDPEVIAWSAYGLGFACKGQEDATVRALAARAASLGTAPEARRAGGSRGSGELDAHVAVARAIGRCGGPLAEQVLVGLGKARGAAWDEPALLGLGDVATRRKQLGAEAMTLLLERASPTEGAPSDVAFYALSRAEPGEALGARVLEAARGALARPGPYRLLAIKTLGRARALAKAAAPELGRVAEDAKFDAGERAEAARGLGALGEPGRDAAGVALAKIAPDLKDPVAVQKLGGTEFHVLYTLLGALGAEPPKAAEPVLRALSAIVAPSDPGPALGRRLAEVRCAAALGLARGSSDAEVLRKCDVETSEVSQAARLASLLRRPLTPERRSAFRAFARSEHLRVREAAVEAISQHPELGDAAAEILADALASKKAGLVATAAEVVHMHPERVYVLAEKEKRAALDPRAPPPTTDPAQDLSPAVTKALTAALAETWPADRFETRIALVEAAAAARHPEAKNVAVAACKADNPVVRERAQRALRTLGESLAPCEGPPAEPTAAPEIASGVAARLAPRRVVLRTQASELSIVLEPELAPVTAARLAALVGSGFYKGIVVHRVVPGFVAQLGDPDADGYGGSGTALRCETSPVPFGPLDVGMALAGRDTGSSQIFVTLARTPHLDGEYTRVGRAEGPWAQVAQGDVITDARLVE